MPSAVFKDERIFILNPSNQTRVRVRCSRRRKHRVRSTVLARARHPNLFVCTVARRSLCRTKVEQRSPVWIDICCWVCPAIQLFCSNRRKIRDDGLKWAIQVGRCCYAEDASNVDVAWRSRRFFYTRVAGNSGGGARTTAYAAVLVVAWRQRFTRVKQNVLLISRRLHNCWVDDGSVESYILVCVRAEESVGHAVHQLFVECVVVQRAMTQYCRCKEMILPSFRIPYWLASTPRVEAPAISSTCRRNRRSVRIMIIVVQRNLFKESNGRGYGKARNDNNVSISGARQRAYVENFRCPSA